MFNLLVQRYKEKVKYTNKYSKLLKNDNFFIKKVNFFIKILKFINLEKLKIKYLSMRIYISSIYMRILYKKTRFCFFLVLARSQAHWQEHEKTNKVFF